MSPSQPRINGSFPVPTSPLFLADSSMSPLQRNPFSCPLKKLDLTKSTKELPRPLPVHSFPCSFFHIKQEFRLVEMCDIKRLVLIGLDGDALCSSTRRWKFTDWEVSRFSKKLHCIDEEAYHHTMFVGKPASWPINGN